MATILVLFVAMVVCVAVVKCAVVVGVGLGKFFWRWSIPLVLLGFGLIVLWASDGEAERDLAIQSSYIQAIGDQHTDKVSPEEAVRRIREARAKIKAQYEQPETLEQLLTRLESNR